MSKEQFPSKQDKKLETTKSLLEANMTNLAQRGPREPPRHNESIASAVAVSTNPFGDDDEDDETFEETNPFAHDADDESEDEDGDDYDKNLNPFAS